MARRTISLLDALDQSEAKLDWRANNDGGTHSEECWKWHYHCAMAKIAQAERRVEQLDKGIRAAMEALSYGKQEQDVVWFSEIETMWDFLAALVDPDNKEDMTRPHPLEQRIAELEGVLDEYGMTIANLETIVEEIEREEVRNNGQFGVGA